MTFAFWLGLDVHHACVGQLLETLGQHRARNERRGRQQVSEAARAEAELAHDDWRPAVAEHLRRLGDGTELAIPDHGSCSSPFSATIFAISARRCVFRT